MEICLGSVSAFSPQLRGGGSCQMGNPWPVWQGLCLLEWFYSIFPPLVGNVLNWSRVGSLSLGFKLVEF